MCVSSDGEGETITHAPTWKLTYSHHSHECQRNIALFSGLYDWITQMQLGEQVLI